MSELILQALEPAALEVSLDVAADVEAQRQRLHQHWDKRLERAAYEVDRASRSYLAVEPENRLVARTLEGQWEEALAAEHQLIKAFVSMGTHQDQINTFLASKFRYFLCSLPVEQFRFVHNSRSHIMFD